MEREDYLELRRKRLKKIEGLYNPAPILSRKDAVLYPDLSLADKLVNLEDDGTIRMIELEDLIHGTEDVIGLNEDGVYEINDSVYRSKESSVDEDLKRLIADAIGIDGSAGQQRMPQKLLCMLPEEKAGIASKLSEVLMEIGTPYTAILNHTDEGFKSVFATGFSVPSDAIFFFSEEDDVCREIFHPRRTLIINSGFSSLTEFSEKVPKCDMEHIPSCCFAPLGAEPNDRYIFFAFDSTLLSIDNVNKIIKKINNISNIA